MPVANASPANVMMLRVRPKAPKKTKVVITDTGMATATTRTLETLRRKRSRIRTARVTAYKMLFVTRLRESLIYSVSS